MFASFPLEILHSVGETRENITQNVNTTTMLQNVQTLQITKNHDTVHEINYYIITN